METKKYFYKCVAHADSVVVQIKKSQWRNTTPCTEWNLRDLLNHMVSEIAWIPDLLEGKTITEIGDKYEGDLLGDNPFKSWTDYYNKVNLAVEKANLNSPVHLSYKDTTVNDYMVEVSSDLLIHSWDVAKSIHINDELPKEIVEQFYKAIKPQISDLQKMGIYSEPIDVDSNSNTQTKLLALLGRDRNWSNNDNV